MVKTISTTYVEGSIQLKNLYSHAEHQFYTHFTQGNKCTTQPPNIVDTGGRGLQPAIKVVC